MRTGGSLQSPRQVTHFGIGQAKVENVASNRQFLGADGKEQLVNYRVRNDYFIVDRLFDRAALILGVGSSQEKVTISRREPGRDWSWLGFGNRSATRANPNPNVLSGVDNAQ